MAQTENEKRQRPRSSMHLAGAVVVPSEEGNSYTFTVNAANSESFKLRAADAKERQHWITRLRVVAQAHTRVLAEVILSIFPHFRPLIFYRALLTCRGSSNFFESP